MTFRCCDRIVHHHGCLSYLDLVTAPHHFPIIIAFQEANTGRSNLSADLLFGHRLRFLGRSYCCLPGHVTYYPSSRFEMSQVSPVCHFPHVILSSSRVCKPPYRGASFGSLQVVGACIGKTSVLPFLASSLGDCRSGCPIFSSKLSQPISPAGH